ncbi:hypothetical protein D3C87_1524180 [compost metagenome]
MASRRYVQVVDFFAQLGRLARSLPQIGHSFIALADSFCMHLDQFEYPFPGLAQMQGQLLDFVLIDAQRVPAGFQRCRAAEPVVGVFDFERFDDYALHILFLYTVIELKALRESEATNRWC